MAASQVPELERAHGWKESRKNENRRWSLSAIKLNKCGQRKRQVTKPKGQEPDKHRKKDEQQGQKWNDKIQNIFRDQWNIAFAEPSDLVDRESAQF